MDYTVDTPSFLPSDNPRVPAAKFPFRHRMPVQLRFTDIDMVGHVNNNVYLTITDLAKLSYFDTLLPGRFDIHNINLVVVHLDVDFYRPTFIHEQIDVWTTVTSVGPRSLHLEQRVVERANGETKCICRTVMSGFNALTNSSMPISNEWIEALDRYEKREFVIE